MEDLIKSALKDIQIPVSSSYDACFVQKMDSVRFGVGGFCSFILNEQLGAVVVARKGSITDSRPSVISAILTPMPSVKLDHLLLASDGYLLALCTDSSVFVMDTRPYVTPIENTKPQTVKRIYSAFDAMDFAIRGRGHVNIVRIRWHPLCPDVFVVLTSNAVLAFVKCARQSNGIHCNIVCHVDLSSSLESHNANHSDSALSSGDESDGELSRSAGGLVWGAVWGQTFVDFDFGSASSHSSDRETKFKDCCVYLLSESGDLIQVAGCLQSSSNRVRPSVRALHILPPSEDNHGADFCSLLCLSAGKHPNDLDASFLVDDGPCSSLPPDVLIMANRDGRLFQGILLNSIGKADKQIGRTSEGSFLCLVDIIDLHLRQSKLSSDDSNGDSSTNMPILALECSKVSTLIVPASDTSPHDESYPFTAYYVIHSSGLHMIRLSWLRDLTEWCRDFVELPALMVKEKCNKGRDAMKNWKSAVTHLLCTRLRTCKLPIQEFRLIGLTESTLSSSGHSSPDLIIVPAPMNHKKPTETCTELVRTIPLYSARELPGLAVNTDKKRHVHTSDNQETPIQSNRSEFSLQLQRLLRQEDLHLPLISAFSLQSGLTQLQMIDFFFKATNLLRSGSLDRLIRARGFVEQYTARLTKHLNVQYTEACNLTSMRQTLQSEAERLSKRHAAVLQRQTMLDKRLEALYGRIHAMNEGPSKADLILRDNVQQLRHRLDKGLKDWFESTRCKWAQLEPQLRRVRQMKRISSQSDQNVDLTTSQWTVIDSRLKQETVEIKSLMNDVRELIQTTKNML